MRNGGGFAAFYKHTPLFSLLPLEGGTPKGRRLALKAVFSLARMPTPPRFARPPLPEEGARMILDRASPTYNCSEASLCLSLPLEGKADDTRIPSSNMRRSRHLNPEPKSPVTPNSKKPEHASSVFWLFYWRLAAKPHRHFSFHPPPEHAEKPCYVERLGYV